MRPRFTHKDYVLIAETIASLSIPDAIRPGSVGETVTRLRIAEAFADALQGTNPAFDRDRFISCAFGRPMTRRDVSRG
jgi:hypothetical protein